VRADDLVKQPALLVLDGLRVERATERARELMPIVISTRLAADRHTVVTINYSTVGEAIDRFRDS